MLQAHFMILIFKGHNILTICRCGWIWCLFWNGEKCYWMPTPYTSPSLCCKKVSILQDKINKNIGHKSLKIESIVWVILTLNLQLTESPIFFILCFEFQRLMSCSSCPHQMTMILNYKTPFIGETRQLRRGWSEFKKSESIFHWGIPARYRRLTSCLDLTKLVNLYLIQH